MSKIKKQVVTCECCGQQFEKVDNVSTCPECESHWNND